MTSEIPHQEEVDPDSPGSRLIDQSGAAIRYAWDESVDVMRLELGGTYLSYVDIGEGEPIVLIPGYLGTVTNFALQLKALSLEYRVIAFDPIGCGFSDRPSMGYTPAEYFKFARRLIEKLGVWPATVVGHSMGGAVAYAIAIENPELVRSLVLIAPRPPVPARLSFGERTMQVTAHRFPRASAWLIEKSARVVARAVAKSDLPRDVFENEDAVRRQAIDTYTAKGSSRVAAKSALSMVEWSAWSGRLREIESPVLVIWGERDRVLPIENLEEITAELPDASIVRIAEVGHVPMLEAAADVNEAITKFVKKVYE